MSGPVGRKMTSVQRKLLSRPVAKARQSKALLTQCFCYTVGLTFQSPIIEIVFTRCQILRLNNCTKFHFGWGFAPDHTVGAYSTPPDPLDGFKGPTCKGIEGEKREMEGRKRREGAVKKGGPTSKGMGGDVKGG